MSEAILIEGLSKRYWIRGQQGIRRSDTLRDVFSNLFRRQLPAEEYWALQGIDLSIEPGEVVGLLGHNGAGKSTLLKILSRITRPTRGRATIRGRVGSLLEVGTGFHPELTGRENVFLNGSILGLSRREITRRFDEIVDFAEVGRFLDTPVKRYSSGMYVRLAFAVAAHLDVEVLLVDEVLAVGDAAFQQKCLGKMGTLARDGRTVVFVSHQLGAVQRLCSRAVLFDHGQVVTDGLPAEVIDRYLSMGNGPSRPGEWTNLTDARREGDGRARFTGIRWLGQRGGRQSVTPDAPIVIDVRLSAEQTVSANSLSITFYDRFGTKLVNADSIALGQSVHAGPGETTHRFRLDSLHLNPGLYSVGLWMADRGIVIDHVREATMVEVVEDEWMSDGARPQCDGLVSCQFDLESIAEEFVCT